MRLRHSGRRLAPTMPVSSLSLFLRLRGLRKNRNWHKRCAAGASNRSSSRWLDCEAVTHHARGAYCGGSSSVYVLVVGAFDFLLIFTRCRGGQMSAPTDLQLKRADYSGWMKERQGRDWLLRDAYCSYRLGYIIRFRILRLGSHLTRGVKPPEKRS